MSEPRVPVYGAEQYVEVIQFRASGKYYCTDSWRVPTLAECEADPRYLPGDRYYPSVMLFSPDFRVMGAALVVTQEPWGHPWLFFGEC